MEARTEFIFVTLHVLLLTFVLEHGPFPRLDVWDGGDSSFWNLIEKVHGATLVSQLKLEKNILGITLFSASGFYSASYV